MIANYKEEQFNINLWFCSTAKELLIKVQKDCPDFTTNIEVRGKAILWWVGDNKHIGLYASSPATLAHECVHAANFIADLTSQKLDPDNDEFYCYLVEHLFRQYCKHVKPTWNRETWII